MFRVEYSEKALKQLKKLDNFNRGIILSWIGKNLVNTTNPRQHGKALQADKAGQWRYRVGSFRILAQIKDSEIVILVLSVGHRKDVYR